MNVASHRRAVVAALMGSFILNACSRPDDSAARDSATASVGDSAKDHAQMAGMDHGPAKDADQEFLRKMSDHHESLIAMMDDAMNRASSATAKADAKRLHDKQHLELDSMVAMLKTSYNETYMPMAMPRDKAMNDSLQKESGAAYDRDMYRHLIMHHQEAVKMVDDFLPRLARPDVKQMAERMRADQQREIQEFQRKQTG